MTTITYVGLAGALLALGWTLWIGYARRDAAVAVNALAALAIAALPAIVEVLAPRLYGSDISLVPIVPFWLAVAGFLHMLGMLGWYDRIHWWDNVTHAVSAALLAALLYAWVLVAGTAALPGPLSALSPGVATIALTLAAGVFWELLEWATRLLSDRVGVDRVLEHYGRLDTPLDLVFDALGAVVVVGLDVRFFLAAFAPIPGLTRGLLTGFLLSIAVGSVASTAIVLHGRRAW